MSWLEKSGIPYGKGDRDGILLVDKETGATSFDIVRKVRRLTGTKKVGHAGTLDPFSTGLLVLLLGQGTKLSPFLMAGKKQYRAEIRLGIETDTYDPEGRVVQENPVPDLKESFVQKALEGFIGEIEQIPPAYSAVRVQGTRAYKLARKGAEVELPRRKVVVHAIDLLSVDLPRLTVEVVCSPGTYVRSLAHDLGRVLETGAHLSSLRRTASGSHKVEDAVDSGLLDDGGGRLLVRERLISLGKALPEMQTVRIGEVLAAKIRNGYHPAREEIQSVRGGAEVAAGHLQLLCDGELVAVIDMTSGACGVGENTKIIRVFN